MLMVFTRKDGHFQGLCLLVAGAGYLDVARSKTCRNSILETIFGTSKVSQSDRTSSIVVGGQQQSFP